VSAPRRPLSRRGFLALCGAAAAGATVGAWRLLDGGDKEESAAATRIVAAIDDRAAARDVGIAYLSAQAFRLDRAARERHERRLIAQLSAANPAWLHVRRRGDVLRLAREGARLDYGAGRVVDTGGWVLSLTEARVCALVFLASFDPFRPLVT
jgi:hypothetical protein